MTAWEYRLEALELPGKDDAQARTDAAAALDRLGADGWQAVGVTPTHAATHGFRVETTRFVVLLKRPLG